MALLRSGPLLAYPLSLFLAGIRKKMDSPQSCRVHSIHADTKSLWRTMCRFDASTVSYLHVQASLVRGQKHICVCCLKKTALGWDLCGETVSDKNAHHRLGRTINSPLYTTDHAVKPVLLQYSADVSLASQCKHISVPVCC
jgi:hypothetical protein